MKSMAILNLLRCFLIIFGTSLYGQSATSIFHCGDILNDTRDGRSYKTVQVGTQCWMAENLNIGTMIDGKSNQKENNILEKYCYDNEATNCDIYGGIYQWKEMMAYSKEEGSQGICPDGWHVSTDNEWEILIDFLGGKQSAGGKMKETGFEHWDSPNVGADNSSGLKILGGGSRYYTGMFHSKGGVVYYWTSNQAGNGYGVRYKISFDEANAQRNGYGKDYGFYVRCLKNL
jgi:uncharacterized protein (TIGR02145 family)